MPKVLLQEVVMSSQRATLEAEALKLSPEERVSLADRLLASVASNGEVEDAWSAEIDRRLAAVEAGRTELVPVDEAIQRARRALS
jgi:putative addiction module component (TIGR02574 family)